MKPALVDDKFLNLTVTIETKAIANTLASFMTFQTVFLFKFGVAQHQGSGRQKFVENSLVLRIRDIDK